MTIALYLNQLGKQEEGRGGFVLGKSYVYHSFMVNLVFGHFPSSVLRITPWDGLIGKISGHQLPIYVPETQR